MLGIRSDYAEKGVCRQHPPLIYQIAVKDTHNMLIINLSNYAENITQLIRIFQEKIIDNWVVFSKESIYFNIKIWRAYQDGDSIEFDYDFYSRIIEDLYMRNIFVGG